MRICRENRSVRKWARNTEQRAKTYFAEKVVFYDICNVRNGESNSFGYESNVEERKREGGRERGREKEKEREGGREKEEERE